MPSKYTERKEQESGVRGQESGDKGQQMIKHFRELIVYQKAFEQAMNIFELTKHFPKEEKFSLTDQIRRSSRSVCANLAEAWLRPVGKYYVLGIRN